MEILKLTDISFKYFSQNKAEYFSIDRLNLSIFEGEFVSVLGPNGSGKSTLLKIVANILEPENGSSELYGKNYSQFKRNEFAKRLAFVPQNSGTNFPYSLYEIVMMGRSPHLNFLGIEREDDHKLVLDTMELLEIDHLRGKGINEVSGGEGQRALIARALVQKPRILLLDEPNAHLDIKHQLSIFNLLHELNRDTNLTVLAISHELNLSNYYSNRALLMKEGKILFDDKPEEILTQSNIKEIFDVESNIISNSDNQKFISLV